MSASSLSVPNPLAGRDATSLLSGAEKLIGYSDPGNVLSAYLRYHSALFLGIIHIENRSNVKSKKIQVFVDNSILMSPGDNPSSNTLELSYLDPDTETNVYSLGTSPLYPWSDVRVMHDDHRIDVLVDDDRYKHIDRFFEKYGLIAYIICAFALMSTIVVVVSLVVGAISSLRSSSSLEVKARSISKSEVEKMAQLLEFIKSNHPEKFAND